MFSHACIIQHPTPRMPLPGAQSSSYGLKPARAVHDPIVSLIPYMLHPADFQAPIKGCTTNSPSQCVQDAKEKGVRITLHQCRPNSTKTTGEAHNRGGKARTGNA